MSDPDDLTPLQQRMAMAMAIRRVREKAGPGGSEITVTQAAKNAGLSRQAWTNYEAGDRQAILDLSVQRKIAEALGVHPQDLAAEYEWAKSALGERPRAKAASTMPLGVSEPSARFFDVPVGGRAKAGARAPLAYDYGAPDGLLDMRWMFSSADSGALRVAGDSMSGYVESGQLVIFDRRRWPRRGEGCVIETIDGELYVKEYVAHEGQTLTVRQRFPDTTLTFDMADVRGVYAIRLRGD